MQDSQQIRVYHMFDARYHLGKNMAISCILSDILFVSTAYVGAKYTLLFLSKKVALTSANPLQARADTPIYPLPAFFGLS